MEGASWKQRKAEVWGEGSQAGPGRRREQREVGKRGEERSRKRGDSSGSLPPTPSLTVAGIASHNL